MDTHIFLKRRTTVAVIERLSVDSVNVIDNQVTASDDEAVTSTVSLDEQIQAVQEKGMILAQNELSEIQFKKLVNLLYRNLDLFATGMRDLVGTDVMYHSIDTGTAEPVRKTAYRQSPEMMREMQRQVNDMMRAGIVEESESPWSSSCLFI